MKGMKDSRWPTTSTRDPGTMCQGCHHNSPACEEAAQLRQLPRQGPRRLADAGQPNRPGLHGCVPWAVHELPQGHGASSRWPRPAPSVTRKSSSNRPWAVRRGVCHVTKNVSWPAWSRRNGCCSWQVGPRRRDQTFRRAIPGASACCSMPPGASAAADARPAATRSTDCRPRPSLSTT